MLNLFLDKLCKFKGLIIDSFNKANQGKELVGNLIWRWGIPSYLILFFLVDRIVRIEGLYALDVIIAALVFAFYSWHIYAVNNCKPKKPKLSKEEKRILKEKKRKEFKKRLIRRLLLQESLSEWNPVTVTVVFDLFCIAHFLSYVL